MAGKSVNRSENNLVTSVWSLRFAALLTLVMGVTNLLSSLTPAFRERLLKLREFFPLSVLNGSRLATALAGFALTLLAFQLSRRKQVAWYFTEGILILSAFTHLFKGLDYEETLFAMLLAIWLFVIRDQFHARSDAYSVRQGLLALGAATLFSLIYGTVGLSLFAHHYRTQLSLWQAFQQTINLFVSFNNTGLAPTSNFGKYFIDSIYLFAIATFGYAIFMLIRPVLVRQPANQEERGRAREIIHAHGDGILAPFALLPDKSYFFSKKNCVIDYVLEGRIALALGDPIGPPKEISQAIQEFKGFCSTNDWTPAFVDIPVNHLRSYHHAEFTTLPVGHEAIVDLPTFSLEGSNNKDLRYASNKLTKLGYTTEVLQPPISNAVMAELRAISETWLTFRKGFEKRFWVGWFDENYINLWPVMTACDENGKRVAFSNILSAYTQPFATVDMMRHLPEAAHGVMEYLFISMFLWARDQGFTKFDLGLCALAGVGTEAGDPSADKAIHYLYEHMTRFFDFQGLHKFKEKFHPEWSPRNLAFPGYSTLPAVVLAMIRADSNRAPITRYFKK